MIRLYELRQSNLSEVINENRQSVNTGIKAIKWWQFAFFGKIMNKINKDIL